MHKKLLLLVLVVSTKCEECDELGVLLYEDLGCKPIVTSGKSCPTRYDCSDFARSNETCRFRSQQIAIGESVNDSLIYDSCRIGCECALDEVRNVAGFNCAVLDCPEWLGDDLDEGNCYRTYTLGECCATGHKCAPFENLTKCVVDGKEYKEGETFNPPNTCFSCLCQKGFDGKFEAPFCKRTTCAEQIDYSEKLSDNCAPVYLDDKTLCCPSNWACPSSSDRIKLITSKLASNLTCKWGEHVLKLGEGLETKFEHFDKVRYVTCECVLPPFLTCKETKR